MRSSRGHDGTASRPWLTGTQMTIVACTLLIVVGFPFAARAVTSGSTVFVTDPSGSVAHVDANGNLQAKVNGQVAVNVNGGAVVADPSAPGQMFTLGVNINNETHGFCQKVATPPTGKALIVTAVHYDMFRFDAGSTPPDHIGLWRAGSSDGANACIGTSNLKDDVTMNSVGAFETTFPSGLPIAAGKSLYATNAVSGTVDDYVFVFGYLVPASACTSPNVCS